MGPTRGRIQLLETSATTEATNPEAARRASGLPRSARKLLSVRRPYSIAVVAEPARRATPNPRTTPTGPRIRPRPMPRTGFARAMTKWPMTFHLSLPTPAFE